ncbi:response regulator transcription factor [Jeotgalicoccus halotolerans]|uniref:Response regulator protein GraR n=1 Tax=Jeotgalicoccus halotolerans TaxID=157227 RepID=A0A3E0B2Q3_9STAP|nr:response regulator transcription factor [Jeotgalicoccus halotolerans]REG25412.1 OmpR family two-component system bacitracin resistance response regulator BceR [Jeotgalicoccus halotolerans]
MKLLIIEDDPVLMDELAARFKEWDIDACGVRDFNDVMNDFIRYNPELVIVDITLPKYDGFYWCRMIRNVSSVPIIFLSSRDHPADMVMSMQMGADDYVQKPFNFEVLNAKVQALLRRTYEYQHKEIDIFKFRDGVFDFKKLTVTVNNETLELTKNESYILSILSQNTGDTVSRKEIIESLWEDSKFISDNTLTVNVNRLRKKLESVGLSDAILTKTGIGYILKE